MPKLIIESQPDYGFSRIEREVDSLDDAWKTILADLELSRVTPDFAAEVGYEFGRHTLAWKEYGRSLGEQDMPGANHNGFTFTIEDGPEMFIVFTYEEDNA
jgi:hypothetical protein